MNQAVDNLGNNQLTSVNVLNTTYAYTVFMRADMAISEGEQLHIRATSYMGGWQSEHLKQTEGYAGGPAHVALYMSAMVSFQHLDMWLSYCTSVCYAGRKCWNCLCGLSLRVQPLTSCGSSPPLWAQVLRLRLITFMNLNNHLQAI